MGNKLLLGAAVGGGVLALGLLSACSGAVASGAGAAATTSLSAPTFAPVPSGADTTPATSGVGTASAPISRCHTKDLSARVGTAVTNANAGSTVTLVYTNISGHTCTMDGYGGVDLHGPADPNGASFSLRRDPDVQGRDDDKLPKPKLVTLAAGGTAHTVITFGRYEPGDVGSMGSTKWVPTQIVSTPPNETTSLTTPWPTGIAVFRDDSATVSHSYISPVESGA